MTRFTLLLALALGLSACGGSDSSSVTQVTVTVTRGGLPLQTAVVMSAGIDDSRVPPVPTGTIATQTTNSSGQTVFTVPATTSTGALCFSSTVSIAGGTSFVDACATLNAISPTVLLAHL